MATYSPEQRRIIALARQLSSGYSRRVRMALLEAMGVESGYRNLSYGDRDSVGVLQQRPSQGWGPASEGPATDIQQFLARAGKLDRGFRGSAGQLAQAIQRSAFPGRYDQRAREALRLLGGSVPGGGAVGLGSPTSSFGGATGANRVDIKAPGDPAAARQAFTQGLLDPRTRNDPLQLAGLLHNLRQGQTAFAGAMGAPLPGQQGPMPRFEVEGKVTPRVAAALRLAQSEVGKPYVWGAEGPGSFDCSGLLQFVWSKQGVKIPRTTYEQWTAGRPIAKGQLRPGDAVFFHPGKGGPGHVGMYIGGGRFIEAPGRGKRVRVSRLAGRSDYLGARRYA